MNKILDYSGTTVSWVCIVHCLAMPFIISFLPLFGLSFLADETTEIVIIGVSIILALISFLPAYFKHHRKLHSILLFFVGIAFIVFSHRFFESKLLWQVPFLLCGAISITAAHLLNLYYCKTCKDCTVHE